MEIRVLGDVQAGDAALSPRERSVLAVLTLHAGAVVTPDELADALWSDAPPATWPKQIQAAIARIRRGLGPSSVTTTHGGYRLDIDAESIDAVRFEKQVGAARGHLAGGDPVRAIDTFAKADALWRGAPYAELGHWPPAAVEAERLRAIRSTLDEDVLEARLASGERQSAVPDAESLVRAEPLRERRWAILATALYRSDRQADALATLRRARITLDEELGIEPSHQLVALETDILNQNPALQAPPLQASAREECPYRGLSAFSSDDEELFFGRDAEIASALSRVGTAGFTAFAGPSGSGKSSLVRAGVVPALRRRGLHVHVVTGGKASTSVLGSAIADGQVIVVDQFEELLHGDAAEEPTDDVCAVLAAAAHSGLTVIIIVRSDYLDECIADPNVGPLMADAVHLVLPMSPDSLRAVVEEPARVAGLRLENGLAELVLRDAVGQPGALPHLSHALVETWVRREGSVLTVDGYESSGGIGGSIAQSADGVFDALSPAEQLACRSILLRLMQLDDDGNAMRRHVGARALRDDPARSRVIDLLVQARLLRIEGDVLAVAHESIATAWPLLRGWLEEDSRSAQLFERLGSAVTTWENDGRSDADLWRGARLQAALEWSASPRADLTSSEREFLDASADRERGEHQELIDRARHERSQNRRLRGLLTAAAILLVAAVIAATTSYFSGVDASRQRDAATASAVATASIALRSSERDVAALLAAESFHRWPDDARTRSALLATFTVGDGFLGNTYIAGTPWIGGDPIPGTETAFIVVDDAPAGVFDITTGERLTSVELPPAKADTGVHPNVRVSADGRLAAVVSAVDFIPPTGDRSGRLTDSELVVVDIASGDIVLGPLDLGVGSERFEFSPDARYIAVTPNEGDEFAIVDLRTGDLRLSSVGSTYEPAPADAFGTVLDFTDDGRLVVGNVGPTMSIVDPASLAVLTSIEVPRMAANVDMTVTPDGVIVAAGERALVAVDANAGRRLWDQTFTSALWTPCTWLAASDATGTVYCGNLWGALEERSLATGATTGAHRDPQLGLVGRLIVSDDERELTAIGSGAPAISRWRLDGTGPITRLIAKGSVTVDGYQPDGTGMLTATREDGATDLDGIRHFSVWDPATDRSVITVPGDGIGLGWAGPSLLSGYFQQEGRLAYFDTAAGDFVQGDPIPTDAYYFWLGASGTRLYQARQDGSVLVFDSATRKVVGPSIQLDGPLHSGASSPDGSLLAMTYWLAPQLYRTVIVDGRTGEQLASRDSASSVVAIRNDHELIEAGNNRITRFTLPDLEPIGTLPGARGGLGGLQLSSDGRTLLAAAYDETVSLYDLDAGIRMADPIRTEAPQITSAFLRQDGGAMLVNVADGVAVWDLDAAHQAAAACRLAGRDLTREEWRSYFPDAPYHSTCGYSSS